MPAGAFHRSALAVAHHHDQPGAGLVAGELHAAEHVFVEHIAGDANAEDVAEALIEDQLGAGTRIDAAQNDRERVLLVRRFVDLLSRFRFRRKLLTKRRLPSLRRSSA
jgi:hypothetical protein